MNVHIIEMSTKHVIATVPVVLQGMNYTPSEQEYFSEAWKCAVADGTVKENNVAKYSFKLDRSA